ncbi:RloB family protein [Planctopirus hydrillae]|uniref:RloB-like protein n=1 Tax=Planctopirus hydrillae TaxID=1841610 RepID=A0A1C3EKG0_9PLAN|nr:RloB family protein [Planctopirus hydrillae]ODA33722.1 hypothetical protein A6X21_18520 [Planctopirus hydrillae]
MSRYRDRNKRPGRSKATRTPRQRILVVCEGGVTEPSYLKRFQAFVKNQLVEIIYEDGEGDPQFVVTTARDFKTKAARRAQSENDSNLDFDRVWCVIDVDDHSRLDQARIMALDHGIELAISNPSFELWLLLHLRESPGSRKQDAIRSLLKQKQHWPTYQKEVLSVHFKDCETGYHQAVIRAKKLDELAASIREPGKNPSTGVYRLTEEIRLGFASPGNESLPGS